METEDSAQGSQEKARRPEFGEGDLRPKSVERRLRIASGPRREMLSLLRMRALLDLGLMVNE